MSWQFEQALAFRVVFLQAGDKVGPWSLVRWPRWWPWQPKPNRVDLTPAGKIVLAELVRFCGVYRPSVQYDGRGRVDPLATAYREGRREVALRVLEYLHLDDQTLQNLREEPSHE